MLLVSMFNTVENYVKTSQMAASCAVKFYSNPGVAVMNARLDFKFLKGKFTLKPYLGQFKNEVVFLHWQNCISLLVWLHAVGR